jgi:microcystin-dependent protein/cytoskeletal protein CcmA (bactofilin family)
MSYKINFTDNVNKESITINDNVINTSTSLQILGRNQKGYAITIAENFLHLLENFAKSTPPSNPIEGQLWYDNSQNVENLMIYNGTSWKSSSSLKKGSTAPSSNILGDLWVDSTNQQLKLFNGASWILVGPTFSSGLRTGSVAEKIKDQSTSQTEHIVLMNYVDDTVVSIISDTAFTPKSGIPGFDTIKIGANLNNSSDYKFWGVSEKAENLIVGGSVIPSVSFLRSDISNTTTQDFIVKNDSGLTIGNEKQLQIRISDSRGVIYHNTPNSNLDFRISLSPSNSETTLLSLDASTGSVLIGANNDDRGAILSVKGDGKFTGSVLITDTTETVNNSTGSLIVSGGVVVSKQLRVNGAITVADQINSKSIIPVNNNSNLGSSSNKFSSVYANTFYGNIVAESITGTLTGNITGNASTLASSTAFSIEGDITAPLITFNGNGSPVVFNTTIGVDYIQNKPELPDSIDVDQILVYRPYVPGSKITSGIYKTNKAMITSSLSTVPIGAIFPFAGSVVPPGYLLCDGSEKQVSVYNKLYAVLQNTYGPTSELLGANTFKLPDLRGRFPLGLNNMQNGDTVPNKFDGGLTSIPSGGGPAGRVNADTANQLGRGAGKDQVTLTTSQMPDHTHTLDGDNGGKYYVVSKPGVTGSDTNSELSNGLSTSTQGNLLPDTGGINATTTGQPISIMNPYLAINYIIYAGVVRT